MESPTPPPLLDQVDVQVWRVYWAEIERRIGTVFARVEARTRAMAYLTGLLSPAERKNGWQIAEISGDTTPYGMQHLLGRADWSPDVLRDRLRVYVTDYLADSDAIGVIDETGFLKKGIHSAGVARQYSGTAGRIENSQIGVFLAYATSHGHTLLDRELYLPAAWIDDRERCRRVGIPDDQPFATKPMLARHMLERTRAAGVHLAWVTGDCIYGNDRTLRHWLEAQPQAYVLAVSGNESVWYQQQQITIKALLADLPTDGWERISAGVGSKGPRWYEWVRLDVSDPPQPGWKRWVVIRRSSTDPTAATAYLTFAPAPTPLAALVRVVGMRWTIEECLQTAKGTVGLDQYEVRSWTGWYRHITLTMWAQALLAVIRTEMEVDIPPKKEQVRPCPTGSLTAFKAQRGLRCD